MNRIINSRNKMVWVVLSVAGGIGIGLMLFMAFRTLSNIYATLFAGLLMVPFAMFMWGNGKSALLIVLTTFLPITLDKTIGDTGHLGGAPGYIVSAFDIVLVTLYFMWILEMVRERKFKIRFNPLVTASFVFLITSGLVSMIFARMPSLSLYELIEIFKMYLAFLYISNNVRSRKELDLVVTVLIVGLAFEGFLGFLQHRFSEPFWPTFMGGAGWIGSRVKGTWMSSNDFSWYLTFVMPVSFGLLFSSIKGRYKLLCIVAFVLGGGALIWTRSRGGWLSFAFSLVFVMFMMLMKMKGKQKIMRVFLAFFVTFLLVSPLYPKLYTKVYSRVFGNDRGSAESRLPQFKMAIDMMLDNPVTGVGLNNYTEVMKDYDITEEGIETITRFPVHNIYLHVGAELGVVGLLAFVTFLMVIFLEGFRQAIVGDSYSSYLVVGMLGGVVAFLLHGVVDTASLGNKLFLFVWFYLGLISSIRYFHSCESSSLRGVST